MQAKKTLRIADMGMTLALDYAGALTAHRGNSAFGAAVTFRMFQVAARMLSCERLWDRQYLTVLSAHGGEGVRDVVEYITRCVSRRRYFLQYLGEGGTAPSRYAWQVQHGQKTVALRLRDGFLPEELWELHGRIGTTSERRSDAGRMEILEWRLSEEVWCEPLNALFHIESQYFETLAHA